MPLVLSVPSGRLPSPALGHGHVLRTPKPIVVIQPMWVLSFCLCSPYICPHSYQRARPQGNGMIRVSGVHWLAWWLPTEQVKMLLQWVPVQPGPAARCLKPCKAFQTCPADTQEKQIKLVCDLSTEMWPCQGHVPECSGH